MSDIQNLINKNNWEKIYKLIIKNKIDLYGTFTNGNTIVHLAAINNNNKILMHCVKTDHNALAKSNHEGNSAIHLLAFYGYIELLKKCIGEYVNFIELQNDNDQTIVNILYNDYQFIKWVTENYKENVIVNDIENNNIVNKNIYESTSKKDQGYKILKLLLKSQNKYINDHRSSFLCLATKLSKIHLCDLLLNNHYDVNKKDSSSITPFIYAIKNHNIPIIKLLIKHNANINYNGPEGDHNPLILSIKNNEDEIVDLLLDNKFDVNHYDRYLETPLHHALKTPNPSPITISKLIYYGNLNIKNIHGETPLHILCKKNDIWNYTKFISRKNLDIFIEDNNHKRPIDYINANHIYKFVDLILNNYYTQIKDENIKMTNCRKNIKSKQCKEEFKKYIFNTKRSIPEDNDKIIIGNKIKMIQENTALHGLFNSDALHNMIYTIAIMKKYENIGIPFQYYFNDKYINDKILHANNDLFISPYEQIISDLSKMYSEFFYEIQPYLVIWRSNTQNYIHRDIGFLVKKCLYAKKIRYIMFKLTIITSSSSTHANILIYDKETKTLERFEPYGIIPYLESEKLDKFIEMKLCKLIDHDATYLRPQDIFENIGFQTISNDSSQYYKKLGDPAGFCLAWTFWYLEMKASNINVDSRELIKESLGEMVNDNINRNKSVITFIRKYALTLDEMKNEFLLSSGIPENKIYDLVLSVDDQRKVIDKMIFEFNNIIKNRYQ